MKDSVVLDIETLGSVNNCVVLSVGMVAVDSTKDYTFEELIENYKLTKGVLLDTELDENDWNGLIKDFKRVVKKN